MNIALLLILVTIVVELGCIIAVLASVYDQVKVQTETLGQIKQFQMNPRTRMKQSKMRNRPVDREDQLARLGRIAEPRRKVVGGEEDSVLHHSLSKTKGVNDGQ